MIIIIYLYAGSGQRGIELNFAGGGHNDRDERLIYDEFNRILLHH